MNHLAPDRTGATLELPENGLGQGAELWQPVKSAKGKAAVVAFRLAGALLGERNNSPPQHRGFSGSSKVATVLSGAR